MRGQLYKCPNRDCGREFRIMRPLSAPNPVCICGSGMKRPYQKPIVRMHPAPPNSGVSVGYSPCRERRPMSKVSLAILLLTAAAMAVACGSVDPSFTPPPVRGQYEMVAASDTTPGAVTLVEVNFTQSGVTLSAAKDSVVVIQATQSSGAPLTLNRFGG